MDERTLRRYRSVVHPLVSFAVPFVFLVTLDRLLRALVLSAILPGEPPGFLLLLAAAGASEVLTGNLLAKRGVRGILPRLRELLLVLIGGYGILVLLVGDFRSLQSAFVNAPVIYGSLLILAQWLMTAGFHGSLRRREQFYAYLVGKRGAELRNVMREYHDEAGAAEEGVRRVRRILVLFQVVVLALLAVYLLAVTPVAPWLLALAIAHEAAAFLAWAAMNRFLEEQAFLGDGPAGSPSGRRWFGALLAAVALAAVLAVAITGRRPIVPPSFLADLLQKIGAWFARRLTGNYRPPAGEGEGGPATEWDLGLSKSPLFAMDQAGGQGSRLVRLIATVIFGAAGALVLFFIVRPLLSRENRAALRRARPLRTLAAKLAGALRGLRGAGGAFLRWLRSPKGAVRRVARAILGGLRSAAGPQRTAGRDDEIDRERRRRLNRTLREFLRIIKWGEQWGVAFQRSMGPLEYVTMLAGTAREHGGPLVEAALAFEEIVFSHHEIGERKVGEFYRAVNAIVRQRVERR